MTRHLSSPRHAFSTHDLSLIVTTSHDSITMSHDPVPSVTWPVTTSHDPSPPQEKHTKKKHIKGLYNMNPRHRLKPRTWFTCPSAQDTEARDWTVDLSITVLSSETTAPQVQPHRQLDQIHSWFSFLWRFGLRWVSEVLNSLFSEAFDWPRWLRGRGLSLGVRIQGRNVPMKLWWCVQVNQEQKEAEELEVKLWGFLLPERSLDETCKYKTSIKFKLKTKLPSFSPPVSEPDSCSQCKQENNNEEMKKHSLKCQKTCKT